MNKKAKYVFKSMFKLGDIIILVVILIAVALTIYFALANTANKVSIYIDGKLKYSYSINSNLEIDLKEDGIDMKVVIKDGKAYVEHSNCPEQLCVHSAPLTKEGGMIVCLPNKVVIKIESDEVDAVTWERLTRRLL